MVGMEGQRRWATFISASEASDESQSGGTGHLEKRRTRQSEAHAKHKPGRTPRWRGQWRSMTWRLGCCRLGRRRSVSSFATSPVLKHDGRSSRGRRDRRLFSTGPNEYGLRWFVVRRQITGKIARPRVPRRRRPLDVARGEESGSNRRRRVAGFELVVDPRCIEMDAY